MRIFDKGFFCSQTLGWGILALGVACANLVFAVDALGYRRPFGPKAPWNVRVEGLPRHPEARKYAKLFYDHAPAVRPGNFNLNFDQYTYPVYYVTDTLKEYPVLLKYPDWGGNLHNTSMPWDPAWEPNKGTDGQVIVLDPENGREWDLWQVRFDGTSVWASNGNLIPGSYWTREVGFRGSRGVGIPYFAMLVTPEEVERGRIRHALSVPVRNTSGELYVAPATKLEHPGNPPGIPEGMRFALHVTNAEIGTWLFSLPKELPEPLRRLARIVAIALRDYGWFITDTSGGAHFQFEAPESAEEKWEALNIVDIEINGKRYPRDLLDGLITEENIIVIVPSDQYPKGYRTSQTVKP